MLQQYRLPAIVALLVFPLIALPLLIPFAYRAYHRYKHLSIWQAVVFFSFVYYLLALLAYILLPLPVLTANFCTLYRAFAVPQLRPFQFIADIVKDTPVLTIQDVLTSRAFLQVFFNILLFVPLGVYFRYYFSLRFPIAVALAFAISLLLELTQFTGIWYLYPCPYRLFDVDDLMLNTTGAIAGYGLAAALHFLPSPRLSTTPTVRTIRLTRRLLAWVIDVILVYGCAFLLYVALFFTLYVYEHIGSLKTMGTLIFSLCVFVVTLGDFVLFPLLSRGATLGKHIVAMTLVTSTHDAPHAPQILLRYGVFILPLTGLSLLQALLNMNGWLHTPLLLLIQWAIFILYIAPVLLRADRQSLGGLVSHTVLVAQR